MSSKITFNADVVIGNNKSIYLDGIADNNKLVKQSDITSQINAIKNATHFKEAVKYTTTANITDFNTVPYTTEFFDIQENQQPAIDDRVLVKDQTTINKTENGIYKIDYLPNSSYGDNVILTRTEDFTIGLTALEGSVVYVTDGAENKDKHFILYSQAGLSTSLFSDNNEIEVTEFGSSNAADIATNAGNIATNVDNIATNAGNIATNVDNIETNRVDIATNASNIETNVTNIGTNAGNIAINAADIATNAGNIATNTTNIEHLQTITGIDISSSGVIHDPTSPEIETTKMTIEDDDDLKTAINRLNQKIYNLHSYIKELSTQIEVINDNGDSVDYVDAYAS